MRVIRMSAWLLAVMLGACTASPARREFPETPERIRIAVRKVLARCQNVQEEGDVIRTGNCPSPMEPGSARLGNWRERHEVKLEGSIVEVHSVVEEGTGRHGTRWDRRYSPSTAEGVLDAIGRALKEDR